MALLGVSSLLRLLVLASCLCAGLIQNGPVAVQAQGPGPLHTNSRWIVDGSGRRVKLACVNWPSHLPPVLAEGLDKQPADVIMQKIKYLGFNCVRFTWPLELVLNDTLANSTVRETFEGYGLNQALGNITIKNPWAPSLTHIQAFKTMLSKFQQNNVMVIVDNHLTMPGWCCSKQDGNGWFGDKFFDPNQWVTGLGKMAEITKEFPIVIGMSLRNELRGDNENSEDWYKYMQQGAESVHASNPNVLVILSGLAFDKDLSFIQNKTAQVSFQKKIVYEVHWYSFTDGGWLDMNLNEKCASISGAVMNHAGFIAHNSTAPLFLSEFGVDGRGTNKEDNRYLTCLLAMAAAEDWDFAVWALEGSYYFREGLVGTEETYGVLDFDWNNVRNPGFYRRYASLQAPFRGPGLQRKRQHKILYHPQSGLCVMKGPGLWSLRLGPCKWAEAWLQRPDNTIQAMGTNAFLHADSVGMAAIVANFGTTQWNMTSATGMHLSTKAKDGSTVCLDVTVSGFLFANDCKCLQKDNTCDPTSQWFKMVESVTV